MDASKAEPHEIAVIGAGASGALFAVQWRRHAWPGARLALIEAGARAARGLAYGTPYGAHLLNVPAGKMSAFPDAPDDFLDWLRGALPEATPATFAPRPLYGEYLAARLDDAVERLGGIDRINAAAIGLGREADGWIVHLRDGRRLAARTVVLALGNLPPHDPLRLAGEIPAGYLRDPWAPGAAQGLNSSAPVLLIGTGLTMVDIVLVLRDAGHRGPLYGLSRHGRIPQAHASAAPLPLMPPAPLPLMPPAACRTGPRVMLHWLRGELRAAGENWRGVMDGMRLYTAALWGGWNELEKARFLRHVRNLWDVHRHRMAPEVAGRIAALRASGSLEILRGRIAALREANGGLVVDWRPAGEENLRTLAVARVINCTGPASDYARLDLPLVNSLRAGGWIRPDRFALGVDTDADGRLLGADGAPVPGLYTLGPLRRGTLWESTAIPEIRAQAAALAALLGTTP